jgi:predicted negative regulator of RcsB-dependent stress response
MIELLNRQRKYNDLFPILKDADFSNWPEKYIYNAAVIRSRLLVYKDSLAAEKDLLLALRHTVNYREKAAAYLSLGKLYANQIKDKEKANAAYMKGLTYKSTLGTHAGLATSCAILLAKKGDLKAAVQVLDDNMKLEAIKHTYWKYRIISTYGDVYAISKDKKKAVEYYEKASAVPGITEANKKEVAGKIAFLKGKEPPQK